MRRPNLARWHYSDPLDGLLLFAQAVEEMVFDHTIDSYKAPALNTHYMCWELISAVEEVREASLQEGVLQPIRDELLASLAVDPAARALLGAHHPLYLDQLAVAASLSDLETIVRQIRTNLRHQYIPEIQRQLKVVVAGRANKELILRLTKSLVSEWINRGLSQGYIYSQAKRFFFDSPPRTIDSIEVLDDFFAVFAIENKTWEVLLRASAGFAALKDLAAKVGVDTLPEAPATRTDYPREKEFIESLRTNERFLLAKGVRASDAETARTRAEAQVRLVADIARLHLHRQPLRWQSYGLVYEVPTNRAIVLDLPKPAVVKRADCASGELRHLAGGTLAALTDSRIDRRSAERVFKSITLHAVALDASAEETQLLAFWSALETLLPPPGEQARITHIASVLAPVLSRAYPEKLLRDLMRSVAVCCGHPARGIIESAPQGASSLSKLAAIVSIDGNEVLRDQLYALMPQNPLLRNRLFVLKRAMESADALMNLIRAHTQRVTWHLQRIYRSRNLLIHTGRRLPYLPALIENLHTYLDWTVFFLRDALVRKPDLPFP